MCASVGAADRGRRDRLRHPGGQHGLGITEPDAVVQNRCPEWGCASSCSWPATRSTSRRYGAGPLRSAATGWGHVARSRPAGRGAAGRDRRGAQRARRSGSASPRRRSGWCCRSSAIRASCTPGSGCGPSPSAAGRRVRPHRGGGVAADHRRPAPHREPPAPVRFAVAGVAAVLAMQPHSRRVARVVRLTLETSGQLAVRICVVTLVGLVWLASQFGLDVLLGAFTAGIVFRLFTSAGSHIERRGDRRQDPDPPGSGSSGSCLLHRHRHAIQPRGAHRRLDDGAPIVGVHRPPLVVRGVPALVVYHRELPPHDRRPWP